MGNDRDSGALIIAFILGGITGAAVALLLAPQSGAETRRKIREIAEEVKDKTTELYDEARHKGTEIIDRGKHIVEEKKEAIERVFEAGKEALAKEKAKKA